jgi:hypothetical protein
MNFPSIIVFLHYCLVLFAIADPNQSNIFIKVVILSLLMIKHIKQALLFSWFNKIAGLWFGTFFKISHILGMSSSQLTKSYFSEG